MSSKSSSNNGNYEGSDPDIIEIQINALVKAQQDWLHGRDYKDLTKDGFIAAMTEKYAYLNKSSNRLFNKAVNGELSSPSARAQVNQILTMLKQVAAGKMKQSDADVIFGKVQADKYVNPLVEKLNKTNPK